MAVNYFTGKLWNIIQLRCIGKIWFLGWITNPLSLDILKYRDNIMLFIMLFF